MTQLDDQLAIQPRIWTLDMVDSGQYDSRVWESVLLIQPACIRMDLEDAAVDAMGGIAPGRNSGGEEGGP